METNSTTQKKSAITLNDYLNNNKELLSILGVFIAVAIFSGTLSIKLIAAFISLCAFTCSTLILIEFWKRPLGGDASFLLRCFRLALFLLALGFFLYWFTIVDGLFPFAIGPVLSLVFTVIWLEIINALRKRYAWAEKARAAIKKRWWTNIAYATITVIAIILVAKRMGDAIELPIFKAVVWVVTVSSKIQGPIQ